MDKTRNDFIKECKEIINSTNSMVDINNELSTKFDEIINNKSYPNILSIIKQLEKETGADLSSLKDYTFIKKKL